MAASSSSTESGMVYVEQCKGVNGLDKIILREARGCSAEVYLYGAQVTSWKNNRGEEMLFLSKKAEFKPPKPIRGGIVLCFPQFYFENYERYGFARSRTWSVDPSPPPLPTSSTHKAFIDLILKSSEEDGRLLYLIWQHNYEYRLRVALGAAGELTLISRIRNINTNGKSLSFHFAYNAHFTVSDVGEVRIEGLDTQDYLDNLKNRERFTEQGVSVTFEEEIDRVYLNAPKKIAIIDHARRRTYVVKKEGLPDAGVWNPWAKKAKALSDFGNDEYKHMLCVQPSYVLKKGITIKPGEEWTGKMEITLVGSSYHSGPLDPQQVRQSSTAAAGSSASKASSRTAAAGSSGSKAGGTTAAGSSGSKAGGTAASGSDASRAGGTAASSSSGSKK